MSDDLGIQIERRREIEEDHFKREAAVNHQFEHSHIGTKSIDEDNDKVDMKAVEEKIDEMLDAEMHRKELEMCEEDAETLDAEEKRLHSQISELEKELKSFDSKTVTLRESVDFIRAQDFRNIKAFIRQRFDVFQNGMKLFIHMLERFQPYALQTEAFDGLLNKVKEELEAGNQILAQFEKMSEQAAKYRLHRCEDIWQLQQIEAYNEMKNLLNGEIGLLKVQLEKNLDDQKEIANLSASHETEVEAAKKAARNDTADSATVRSFAHQRVTNTFNHLNLDRYVETSGTGNESPVIHNAARCHLNEGLQFSDSEKKTCIQPSHSKDGHPTYGHRPTNWN